MDFRLQSPYCSNYKIPSQQKGLIMQHLIVRKLTRRELEDKYLRLIDENYDLKRENNVQKEKIKVLTTKLLRLTKENSRYKSREFLFMEESQDLNDMDEFFRPHRPMSSSAIPRKSSDEIRNSTPNLARLKSDISLLENIKGNHSNKNAESENTNSNSKNIESTSGGGNKIKEMEDEIEKLHHQLEKLREVEELERRTNAQLEIQINELREKLASTEVQKELEATVEISELNTKVKELQTNLDELDENYKKKMDESKVEYEKMCDLLEKERNKIKRFEAQSHDFESSQKMIDELMQQVTQLEKEKMEIAKQYEKYAVLSDELAQYKIQINELNEIIQQREEQLEKERADKESIQHSQDDLLRKMKQLQQDNDELVVKLEGLQSENETLLNKNKKLEDRVKVLEDQNKKYLRQVNDTLKMPTPVPKEKSTMIANATAEVQRHKEMHERLQHQKSINSSPEKTFNSYCSSPPNLSVPSVKVQDEKRPSTPEKELRVIPKIVEPSTSNNSSQPKDSHDEVSTIPPDSLPGTSKNFAEVFSQSVSKETPNESVDDEFDPKTFSIDQILLDGRLASEKASECIPSVSELNRTKEMLVGDIFGGERLSQMKKVRLSMDLKLISSSNEEKKANTRRHSIFSNHSGSSVSKSGDFETLGDVLKNISTSRNSTCSSCSSKRSFTSIPRFVLENINDEKLLLKHSFHRINIEIINLVICENSSLLTNENARFLYIEYTFLDFKGHLMETQALPKPRKSGESVFYHFENTFELQPSEDKKQFKMLKAMLEKNSKLPIKFMIVSEPLENQEDGECEEVGFGIAKLNEIVEKATEDIVTQKIDCFSTEYPHELIAYLNIKITGAMVMKKLRKLK